ncbi:hypothetical protein ACJZ2D_013957 [Fusarium nematophilum]
MAALPSILPISSSDLPTLAEFIHSSKLRLAINRLLFHDWPNDASQKPIYSQAVESAFNNPAVHCLKAVDQRSKDIIGYLVLTRKQPEEGSSPEEQSTGGEDAPDGMNPDVFSTVVQAAKEISQETDKLDRLELTYIYVNSSHRRQGIGSLLMQEACSRAEAEGVTLSVCSEPAAYEFFKKRGFQDTRHVDIDLCKWAPPYSGFGLFRLSGMVWTRETGTLV